MGKKDDFTVVNISTSWLESIKQKIDRLEELERVCRDGLQGEFIDPQQQIQFLKGMLTETKLLLMNTKLILTKALFLKLTIVLKRVEEQTRANLDELAEVKVNNLTHTKTDYLTPRFLDVVERLSKARGEIINVIGEKGWLFPLAEETEEAGRR